MEKMDTITKENASGDNIQNWIHELEKIMGRLRRRDGCPWDREQTHRSLKKYLVEETYELIDAIESEDDAQMIDELGDILLQVIFHCQIAKEDGRFRLQEVARQCCKKMIRRHPHVFGHTLAEDSAAVLKQWETIKKTESSNLNRTSALDGIPKYLPALTKAEKIQMKASKVGFDWASADDVVSKIEEELDETKRSLQQDDKNHVREELGDLLFAVVNLCRFVGESPEDTLLQAIDKFSKRFRFIEAELAREGEKPDACTMSVLERLWQESKTQI